MGNTSKKLAERCDHLSKEEQKFIAATFRAASRNSDKIQEEDLTVSGKLDAVLLEKLWSSQIDPRLMQYLTNFLFGFGPQKATACDFNTFAQLYVFNVRGSAEERVEMMYTSLGMKYGENVEIPYQLLREFCESLASTYIKIVKSIKPGNLEKWIDKGFRGKASHVQALGEGIAASVGDVDNNPQLSYNATDLLRWVQSNIVLKGIAGAVFVNLFGGVDTQHLSYDAAGEQAANPPLVPLVEGIDPAPRYPAFIDISHIVWINSYLPREHQYKWRFLFSTHIHGESFSTLAGRITEVGSTVLIVEDTNGFIFGGFAAESWEIKSTFYGKESSFLFTLAPKMRQYHATTFNNHYQYINMGTKTLPNGLMMGGQYDFEGIWINADPFGLGRCAESCSSYRGYKRLSKEAKFNIKSLEVWGVGDKPVTLKASDERDVSCLDRNPEAKAILELAGRKHHSDGIREPPAL